MKTKARKQTITKAEKGAERKVARWHGPSPAWLLAIGAAMLIAWMRMVPLSLDLFSATAASSVRNSIMQKLSAQIPTSVAVNTRRAEAAQRADAWIGSHPMEFESAVARTAGQIRQQFQYRGGDGETHVFLADYDSYHWLRMARNYLNTGTTCDEWVAGKCRDTMTDAPVGRVNHYARSLHIAAIVVAARVMAWVQPGYPLQAASYLVPVVVGALGAIAAFGAGDCIAGSLCGLAAAIVIGLNPIFLKRTMGSDNDVWNIVLPLFMFWMIAEAMRSTSDRRRIAYAVGAAAFAGLHAATWSGWFFAYAVMIAGIGAAVGLHLIRAAANRLRHRAVDFAQGRNLIVIAVAFYVAAAIFVTIAGRNYLEVPLKLIEGMAKAPTVVGAGNHDPSAYWPNVFSGVVELQAVSIGSLMVDMAGAWVIVASWLGLLLMFMPETPSGIAYIGLIAVAACVDVAALQMAHPARIVILAGIAVPIVVAIALGIFDDREGADPRHDMAMIVAGWLFATLYLSFEGSRYVMLTVPAMGLGFGVVPSRLYGWLRTYIARMKLPAEIRRIATPAAYVLCAALILPPIHRGYINAQYFAPQMNRVWWDSLTWLRTNSPDNAIIDTWWDYGYWIKYGADRRVSNDGGSLSTHIPYWVGRALVTPDEREAAGIFRMLNCGSDATPYPSGSEGAYGKLLANGLDSLRAHRAVVKLANMDRTQGDVYLAGLGLNDAARVDVLRSADCTPAPSYLILSSAMATLPPWFRLGAFDFAKSYAVRHARYMPEDQGVADLAARFEMSSSDARALYRSARVIKSQAQISNFTRPDAHFFAGGQWLPCVSTSDTTLACATGFNIGPHTVVGSLTVRLDAPASSTIELEHHDANGKVQREVASPALIRIANADGVTDIDVPSSTHPELGLLLDADKHRILVAAPFLLRSTFTQLVYLDGRYSKLFKKVNEQKSILSERVSVWKISWPDDAAPPSGASAAQ